jgi:hypothetical protein
MFVLLQLIRLVVCLFVCLYYRGGNLFHRIRLLPAPLNDRRLVQLLRQADMVLDSFPIGNSFYFHSLALSVGTPVITLRTGSLLQSPKDDLKEMRKYIMGWNRQQRKNNGTSSTIVSSSNPMAQQVAYFDLPWAPAISAVAGYYTRCGLSEYFVANSTADYFRLASNLATNRYECYSVFDVFCREF